MSTRIADNNSLAAAFEAFNAHSEGLREAYGALQSRVDSLGSALKASQAARERQTQERDRVAARLAQLLEALPQAVIVIDQSGVIVDANVNAMHWFERSLIGLQWRSIELALYGSDGFSNTDVVLNRQRTISGCLSMLTDDSRMIVFTDVTDVRANQAQVERQERLTLLGEMAARVAHQIRTPLTAAMLHATNPNIARHSQQHVVARLQDIDAMVDDMLRFARGTPPAEERTDSVSLLQEVIDVVDDTLPEHIELVASFDDQCFGLQVNRVALVGALQNLVINAAQHCDDNGRIVLRHGLDAQGNVLLQVEDNGCGVEPAARERLFEPFFTTRSAGTGLGLAVVRSVARAHQGDVHYEATESGSIFSISLPLVVTESKGISPAGDASQFAISANASSASPWAEVCHG